MKRGLALFISIFFIISLLAGCSSGEQANQAEAKTKDGKTVVNFWSFWGSETRRPIIDKIVKDFNNSQDKIVVKHTFLPWGDIWTKNLASVAAGNPADVVINDINTVAQRAKNNQAEDLSKYVDDSFKNEFYPHLWQTVLYKDKPYGVPFNTDTRLLFYNKTAFKEAGLDPNKPPQTWAELEEYAKKLDKKNGNRYERIGFYPLWGSIGASSWMASADGGKGFIDNGKLNINTPQKVKALKWLQGWKERLGDKTVQSFQADFGSQQANPFIAGKVAMWADVGTFYTQIRDYGKNMDFGVAQIPAYNDQSKHWADGGGFVAEVPKGSKHPKEAMEFIKYLTGEKAQKYWALKNYDNVANKKGAEAAANELSRQAKDIYKMSVDNLKVTNLYPTPVEYPDYQNRINPYIDNVMLGKVSPEKALKQAEEDVKKMKK
ncbi:ABC transporter substrate-binding protein [Neobacillus terrae]|uniref:ABC transporter substrate-binding protein n=1 Tax=Neobacillus terrae TaxID=3034837 RepID=UPI0014096335|nr:ABC transporter substrate-binding protein [Neobacillus terrae]NHM29532.1 ABC transporter substrate-binding protein [Neobacillus terrae]